MNLMIQKQVIYKSIYVKGIVSLEESPEYELEPFIKLKDKLNVSKSSIDKYQLNSDVASLYNRYSNKIRLTNQLRLFITHKNNGQNVTRAWVKFYEIHSFYKTIQQKGNINVFFNAELPGASICAFNHYVKTLRPHLHYTWVAASKIDTKKDSRETLTDQYCILEKNPSHWLMNKDNNGDMTNIENILNIEKRLGQTMDIYTHDAGIGLDDTANFNIQEEVNAKLHLGCALMGFLVLKIGGNFIAKQYTFFESFTLSLLVIYASMFNEFFISKPMSSGQANSEVYLIGKGYKGLPDMYRSALTKKLINFTFAPLISKNILTELSALNEIQSIGYEIFTQQIEYIDRGIGEFKQILKSNEKERELIAIHNKLGLDFSKLYTSKYLLKKIKNIDHIPSC